MKVDLQNPQNTALDKASYDAKTGLLELAFNENKMLQTKKFQNVTHIDSVKVNGNVHELGIHSDNGPKDAKGRYIYNRETTNHQFSLQVGKGIETKIGVSLEFFDNSNGTGAKFYDYKLTESGKNPATPPNKDAGPSLIEEPLTKTTDVRGNWNVEANKNEVSISFPGKNAKSVYIEVKDNDGKYVGHSLQNGTTAKLSGLHLLPGEYSLKAVANNPASDGPKHLDHSMLKFSI